MDMKLMQKKCDEVASIMKHFSHPQRLLILCFLSDGEKSVSLIQEAVGISQSQTSQFLRRMQAEGLLKVRREKNFSFYSIENEAITKLVKSMQKIFC
jgi:DNA-binding transcriptional ArsR family regulator